MTIAYLSIFIAALFFSLQFLFSKMYQKNSDSSLLANLWWVEMYGVWVLLIFFTANRFTLTGTPQAAVYALFYAVSSIGCMLASVLAVSLGKIATVTLYMMIGGQAVPFVYSLIFTGAQPTWLDYLGFAVILASCLPGIVGKNKSGQQAESAGGNRKQTLFLLLCMVVFFGNGFVSVFSDVNAKSAYGAASTDFLILCALWTLAFCTVLLVWQMIVRHRKGLRGAGLVFSGVGKTLAVKSVVLVFCVSGGYTVLNGLGNIFSLQAAGVPGMQSSVQFPILNSAIMILTAVLGRVVYREKVSRRDLAGLIMAVAGILLFMLSFLIYGI